MNFRLGTRGSELALTQSRQVASALRETGVANEVEIISLVTSGDQKQAAPENTLRDKKDWIVELEQALLRGAIDFAVHSAKDVPIDIEPETELIPILSRAQPWDVLIFNKNVPAASLLELPPGARIGTSSVRRTAQLLYLHPELIIEPFRGNVPTRLEKLYRSNLSATVLALAGLYRLDLKPERMVILDKAIPAVNQGILVAQVLRKNAVVIAALHALTHADTARSFFSERRVVELLHADCHSALSVFCTVVSSGGLEVAAEVFSRDGRTRLFSARRGSESEGVLLADRVAEDLLSQGAEALLHSN